MPEHQFHYDVIAVLLNATSIRVIENVEEKQNGTISDTDPAGAMHFTIAVVLVYGVGVIGLLGISARRNRRVEMMDKEVNKYIKSLHTDRPVAGRSKSKRSIYKLVSSLHARSKASKNDKRHQSDRHDKLLLKSLSWTAGVAPKPSRKSSVRGPRRSQLTTRTILQQIAENQSEEAMELNESSPYILTSSSPALHLDIASTNPQNRIQRVEAKDVRSNNPDVPNEVTNEELGIAKNEKQETVVNVSSLHENMVDRKQTDNTVCYNVDNPNSGNDDEKSTDRCSQMVVLIPHEEWTHGHRKGNVLHI